jgi:hypothetical protein
MQKITAFNNDVYKFNIFDDGLQIPNEWISSAMEELQKPEVQKSQSCNLDKGTDYGGILWSTFETPAESFFSFAQTEELLGWIKEKAIPVAPALGFDECKSADLTIDWMNVMYRNSFGNCHTHDDIYETHTTKKVVTIFYLQAPENSSDLLVVKNTKDYSTMGVSPFTIPDDEIFPIKVKTGDLLIHTVDLPHAVSKHNTDVPRLCLVMEFQYNEK